MSELGSSGQVMATRPNMVKYAREGLVCYSPITGEVNSADAGDYFFIDDEYVIRDDEDMPMVLAVRIPEHFVPILRHPSLIARYAGDDARYADRAPDESDYMTPSAYDETDQEWRDRGGRWEDE